MTGTPAEAQRDSSGPRIAVRQALAPPQGELNQLVAHMRAQRYREVELRTHELLVQYPESGIIWKFLGVSLGLQGKQALDALDQAARLLPQDAEAHLNLGNAMRVAGRLDDAAASYRRALDLKPDNAGASNSLGAALLKLGHVQEALTFFRRALAIDPAFALAHGNLGYALQRLGRPDEALVSLQRAVGLAPDFAAAHTNLGNALRDLGRLDEALASHRLALKLKPEFTEAGINLGNVLRDLGQSEAAVEVFRRVLGSDANSAAAHGNLACALRDLGRTGEAEASFRAALRIDPQYADAHRNLGVVLRHQNRIVEAEASCLKALEIDPDLPAALLLIAELRADKGRFAEAEALFKRVSAIDPNCAEAWAGISGLRKMTVGDADWLAQVLRMVGQKLPAREEIPLRYAIGKYYDDVRDYAQAFANYRRANELTKQCIPKHDRRQLTETVNAYIRQFDSAWIGAARGGAGASPCPVLIVGMPRSGTSLAEQILASHPAVSGAGELPYWTMAAESYGAAPIDRAARDGLIGRLGQDYVQLLARLSPGAVRVVDKMPSNFLFLGLIHAALPNARILHMRRNPIDTCLSIYFQNFDVAHSYANDLEDLAHYFGEYSRLMQHWGSSLPKHAMMEVPYEGLVDDQEAWSRKMLEFIGLPWDDRCIDFRRTERSIVTRSRWQVRQAINRSSVGRWRNYREFIAPLLTLQDLDR